MTLAPFDAAIDVGDAQPAINWREVAAAGITVAMIKATEGTGFTSPTFAAQRAGAEAAGIKTVPYHFLRPGSADAQVARFKAATQLAKNQPYALDWEGRAAQTAAPAIVEAVGVQLQALTGRTPLGYWGIPGSTPAAPTAAMQGWDRWIPRYPKSGAANFAGLGSAAAKVPPGALFWQYTCWGKVAGIPVAVDRSVFFGSSLADLLAWYATGARPLAPAA